MTGKIAALAFPRPFSLNNKDANSARGGRHKTAAYLDWLNEAKAMIMAAGPRPFFIGSVRVSIEIGTVGVSLRFDGDNAVKPVLDVLVEMGVIPDDNRCFVRSGSWIWVNGYEGMLVKIEEST